MLEISPRKVVHIIFQAREKNWAEAELHAFIDALNEDEQASLVAIAWIGRETYEPEDLEEAIEMAKMEATTPTADYLTGMPLLPDYLEDGLERLGVDVTDEEEDFL
ncbi:DUF3775 domain-containing protein [Actibacterium sp.]|uniref:DUF3775 domain-containing protein n=1 Tax=Actibacterium sp. TaxID=1872125 RepID=UPI003561CC01